MDAYEATRVVFSRLQQLDPDHAAKIMGLLLIQDHGEKEMIRLAFGPESLLLSVVAQARKDLGLIPLSSSPVHPPPFLHLPPIKQQPSMQPAPSPRLLAGSPPAWPQQQQQQLPFSRAAAGVPLDLQPEDDFFAAADDALQEQLGFLGDDVQPGVGLFNDDYSPAGWGADGGDLRRSFPPADCDSSFWWKPCLYFARGYCKNGASCRFVHSFPDDAPKVDTTTPAAVPPEHDILMRAMASPRFDCSATMSQIMASAFPFSPSSKGAGFHLHQHNEAQRAAAAAALLMAGDDAHKYAIRSPRIERGDLAANLMNPGARQIYLTFPADSTFSEEDVSNYFSIYGPVQDVRIPYQQKRMFGFVTFVYPETVKMILAKGNPHFVCDARVLVKPYKEKGKVPDKFRKQQLSQLLPHSGERGEMSLSACSTPTGLLDAWDPFELPQLGTARMLYGNNSGMGSPESALLLRRKLEEQQQSAELQQAIELQGRRFVGLHLDLNKGRNQQYNSSGSAADAFSHGDANADSAPTQQEAKQQQQQPSTVQSQQSAVNGGMMMMMAPKESGAVAPHGEADCGLQESAGEHNLPDSPFASPTKANIVAGAGNNGGSSSSSASFSTLLAEASNIDGRGSPFNSCFFQLPSRYSSPGHGTIGM